MSIPALPIDLSEPRETRQTVHYYIVEGDSEANYISQLLKLARELGDPTETWKVILAGGGKYANILQKVHTFNEENPSKEAFIWMDDDLLCRDKYNMQCSNDRLAVEDLHPLLNIHKFEDFIIMHFPADVAERWQQTCENLISDNVEGQPNYINYPFEKKRFSQPFLNFLRSAGTPRYRKGQLPFESLDLQRIKHLIFAQSNNQIFCKSDIVGHIERLLKGAGIQLED